MANLHADENYPIQTVRRLRELGHDVLTTNEAGRSNRGLPDEDVLRFATEQGRAVVTMDRRGFLRLHSRVPGHAGIVVCSEDPDHAALAERVHAALLREGDLRGRLVRVHRPPSGGPARKRKDR